MSLGVSICFILEQCRQCPSMINLESDTSASYLVCKYSPPGNVGTDHPYRQGRPCAACPDNCAASETICKAGSSPTECDDFAGYGTFILNGEACTDCECIIDVHSPWCESDLEVEYELCPLTCGDCAVPEGIGLDFCGSEATTTSTSATLASTTAGNNCDLCSRAPARHGIRPVV
jgi:hypothetical protein